MSFLSNSDTVSPSYKIELFDKEEILNLHFIRHNPSLSYVFLWKHHYSAQQLISFSETHFPQIKLDELETLKPKRLIEKLSVRTILAQILPECSYLAHNDNGAPFLPNSPYYISISHARLSASATAGPLKEMW